MTTPSSLQRYLPRIPSTIYRIRMEFETHYPATEELQQKAAKQLFFSVLLKKKWIGILAFWIASGLSLFAVAELGWALTGILLGVSFILTSMWVKTYFMFQKQAKDYLKTIEDPLTTLKINREEMDVSNSNGSKRITWDKVDRVAETKDFLVPLIGKTPLICLPKDKLSHEVSAFLRQL